jgi:hypothetical protein
VSSDPYSGRERVLTDDQLQRVDAWVQAAAGLLELLHCHFHPVTRLAEQLVERELGTRTEAVIDSAVSITEERSIDRLAAALASLLPPFRLEADTSPGPCQMAPPNAVYPPCTHAECIEIRTRLA